MTLTRKPHSQPIETVPPVVAPVPIEADAPRVEVRSQEELAEAVAHGSVPVLAAPQNFSVGTGVLVEARVASRVAAVDDARVMTYDKATVFAGDDVRVESRGRSRVWLYGRAHARLYDDASGKAYLDSGGRHFFDGLTRTSTDVQIWLYDDAVLESWAPGSITGIGRSSMVLHGGNGPMQADVSEYASASVNGDVSVEAADDSFVVANAGTVSASGRAVVVASLLDEKPPVLRGAGQAVLVVPAGVDAEGPRVVQASDAQDIDTWLSIWGLDPVDGRVELSVAVNARTGSVAGPGWSRKPPLAPGGLVPANLPVLARPAHWYEQGQDGLRLLTVRVPVGAVRPSNELALLYRAYAGEGAVVG